MDAVVMCGGEGSRLRAGDITTEKPLLEVGGRPMLDRLWTTLADSRVDSVHAAISPAAPQTGEYARGLVSGSAAVIETPGNGYVADLDYVLASLSTPILTVAVDLPLLTSALIDRVLATARGDSGDTPSTSVCVPVALKHQLGASVDTTLPPDAIADTRFLSESTAAPIPELAPTGINVVADAGNATWISYDARLAVNVNRPADLELAEALCP
jgi:adenosylcobinamide-phosphate guanylyltransferase